MEFHSAHDSQQPSSRQPAMAPQSKLSIFASKKFWGLFFGSTIFLSIIVITTFLYLYLAKLNVFSDHDQSIKMITDYRPTGNTYVYDRQGKKIGEFFNHYRIATKFEDLPQHLVNAIVSIEDRNFWEHSGYDIKSIARAGIDYVKGRITRRKKKYKQGASTITQQVVRKFLLTREKSIDRKVKEIALAIELEKKVGKKKIFEAYTNRMFLGNGAYGVGAAAQRYFGKTVQELTLAESALVAGLFQLPSSYNPMRYPKRAKRRQSRVLHAMYRNGYISRDQGLKALKEKVRYKKYQPINQKIAPHFVDFINLQAKKVLASKFDSVASQGLRIHTTLDLELQAMADKTFKEADAHFKRIKLDTLAVKNKDGEMQQPEIEAALLTLDAKTGEVLAMVGGRNYKTSQFNRTTQALRSPGSAFKTILFSKALETGWKWSDMLYVSPIAIEDYRPRNAGGNYLTETTLAHAFYRSINTPAVELGKKIGLENIISYAQELGVKSPIKDELGSILGSSNLSMLELAEVYGVFANQGQRIPPISITKITDSQGKIIYAADPAEDRAYPVVSPETAFLITKGLENVFKYGTGFASADLAKRHMVGKTGTSNQSKDNWFCGYSSELVTLVWVGTDGFHPIPGKSSGGSRAALPLWDNFMRKASFYREPQPFEMPEGIVEAKVDHSHGYLSDTGITMYFKEGQEPTEKATDSPMHVISRTGHFRNILD